ncbi:MAG: hypothetical protein COA79_23575 [Planctomycetota bacterium]|nr:MAG: hypothetical protein COA79_23575 [Planctomycetota bacterium]
MFRLTDLKYPVIQGSMGIGFSWFDLVVAVSKAGGLGTLTTVCIDRLVAWETGDKSYKNNWEKSIEYAVDKLRGMLGDIPFGFNIMEKQTKSSEIIELAFKYKVPSITVGAGFNRRHFKLAEQGDPNHDLNFMYMINGIKAAQITILASKRKNNRVPDALILEGPKAGGHNGFRTIREVNAGENSLEGCFEPCRKILHESGVGIVIAGGIWGPEDWKYWKEKGADCLQAGTAFLGSQEANLDPEVRERLYTLKEEDIITSDAEIMQPGSPTKFAFKVFSDSPGYLRAQKLERPVKCSMSGILKSDNSCAAHKLDKSNFCICPPLTRSSGFGEKFQGDTEQFLMTCGSNGYKIRELATVLNDDGQSVPYEAKRVVDWFSGVHNKSPEAEAVN